MTKRRLDIILHDTSIGVWQDNANDPSFRAEIYGPLLRLLRGLGWTIGADPQVRRHHRILSPNRRLGTRGDLRVKIGVCGRSIEIEFWSEAAEPSNPNGKRHDFDKRERAPYLDRVRIDLETRRILAWLRERAEVNVKDRISRKRGPGPGEETAEAWIARDYAESWHVDKALGRPRYTNGDRDRTAADGGLIDHGAHVWFTDRKGRVLRGIAHYRLNDRWTVQVGRYGLHHLGCGEIFTALPADIRCKRNARQRRSRLEGELATAIRVMNFRRAETLRQILFGTALTYGIWATDHDAYYRPNYSGYTTDCLAAGRYTWNEAAKEVSRVPHDLMLVLPSGERLTALQIATARAA